MISRNTYLQLKENYKKFNEWVDSIRDKNGYARYRYSDIPEHIKDFHLTNDEISSIEEYEFFHNPPDKYYLYAFNIDFNHKYVGTFTGRPLGKITFLGEKFKTGFFPGAERQYIKFIGINGYTYGGWYYCGSGDYCRVKKLKNIRVDPQVALTLVR